MSEFQEIDETLHTEVEIKPTLDNEWSIGSSTHGTEMSEVVEIDVGANTQERPFQCTFCPKKFKLKQNCNRHIRTHTGVKPVQILL